MSRLMAISQGLGIVSVIGLGSAEGRPLSRELPPKHKACFERVYEAAHLKSHPGQQVTKIRLVHSPEDWPALNDGRFYISLLFTLRERRAGNQGYDYRLGGLCKPSAQALTCKPEWEAGTWRIEAGPAGSLDILNGNIIANPYTHDAEEIAPGAVRIKANRHEARWRLYRVAADAACRL